MAIFLSSHVLVLHALSLLVLVHGFSPLSPARIGVNRQDSVLQATTVDATTGDASDLSRRSFFTQSSTAASLLLIATSTTHKPQVALAASGSATKQRASLESSLYTILRVREATQQESRLIKSGKFKDLQRANVKLAVKFMIENYRLNDAFVGASTYLDGNDRRVAAVNVGQSAVQDLYTILEYFDSSDVQNLKVRQYNTRILEWRENCCAESILFSLF